LSAEELVNDNAIIDLRYFADKINKKFLFYLKK
jgi:hypothetical protein